MYIDFIEGDELRIMREMSFHPDYMKEVTRQVHLSQTLTGYDKGIHVFL